MLDDFGWKLFDRSASDTWCSSAVNRSRLSLFAASRTRRSPADASPQLCIWDAAICPVFSLVSGLPSRSEEHTSELQSLRHLVCRLLLAKRNRIVIRALSLCGCRFSRYNVGGGFYTFLLGGSEGEADESYQ